MLHGLTIAVLFFGLTVASQPNAYADNVSPSLEAYRAFQKASTPIEDQREAAWQALDEQEKRLATQYLESAIANFPDIQSSVPGHLRDVVSIARFVEIENGMREFLRWLEFPEAMRRGGTDAANVVRVMAAQGGTEALPHLLDLIEDADRTWETKVAAQVGLVAVSSRPGIEAWLKLRDAARSMPNAPKEQAAYTHAERMHETALILTEFIPFLHGPPPGERAQKSHVLRTVSRVDECYCTGTIEVYHNHYEYSIYGMIRFNNEWLIAEHTGTVIR